MKKLSLIRVVLFIIFAASLSWEQGCGTGGPGATTVSGGNPAAPPAPPSEIPAALTYPTNLGINVDTVATSASPSSQTPLVGASGQFSDEISFGANLTQILNAQVSTFLQPLPSLDIPVSTSETSLHVTSIDPQDKSSTPVQIDITIDFSKFDFDGDGQLDGTGCTCPVNCTLPACPTQADPANIHSIAYRVWFNGERRMAGLFSVLPTHDNPGAGQYRTVIHTPAHNADPARDVYIAVIYDHTDPFAKSTTVFERGVLAGDSVDQPDAEFPSLHADVSQKGPDATAKKVLRLSGDGFPPDFSGVTGQPARVQYAGQWREDNDFWSGSVTSQNINIQNFSDQCAFISTANPVDVGDCQDLGIDVANLPFINFLTADDVRLPADFPLTSTVP